MTIDELKAAGGEEMEKGAGHRVYFHAPALAKLIGLDVQRNEEGKITGGTLKGQELSYAAARKIYASLSAGGFFYDRKDDRFHYDPLIEEYAGEVIGALRGGERSGVAEAGTPPTASKAARRPRKNEPLIGLKTGRFTYARDLHLSGPNDVAEIYRELKNADREKFIVMALDGESRLIGTEVVSMGTLNYNLVHPREVFKTPVMLGAAKIVCLHNHPSGTNEPSDEDMELTKRLRACGEIIGVEMSYHVVLGENNWAAIYGDGHVERQRLVITEADGRKEQVPDYEVYQKSVKHGEIILKPADAIAAAKRIFDKDEKASVVFMLNTRNEVLTILDAQASSNSELLRRAICVNAASMVVCAGGKHEPEKLNRLIRDTKKFGIELLDAIDVTGRDADGRWKFVSHKQTGTLREAGAPYPAAGEEAGGYRTDANEDSFTITEQTYAGGKLAEIRVCNTHLLRNVEGLEDLKDRYAGFMAALTEKITETTMFGDETKRKIVETLNSEAAAGMIARNGGQPEVVIYAGLCMAEGGSGALEKYGIPGEMRRRAADLCEGSGGGLEK